MKTKLVIYFSFLSMLILTSTNVMAQFRGDNGRNQPDRRQKIESFKIGFITQKLNLTPQEAQKFWPVYNEYQAKKQGMQKSMVEKYRDYRLSKEATEKQATALIDSSLNVMQANLNLARDYYGKLKAILPPQKIILLFNAERQFRRELLQRLADRNNRNRHDKE
jgi:Spy/CpxP family protein refolding chaperone